MTYNHLCAYHDQNVESTTFETNPILFGDFMKMGADPADRIYEELADVSKVKSLLADVRSLNCVFKCFAIQFRLKAKFLINNW